MDKVNKEKAARKIRSTLIELTKKSCCVRVGSSSYDVMLGSGYFVDNQDFVKRACEIVEFLSKEFPNIQPSVCADCVGPDTEFILNHKGEIVDENYDVPNYNKMQLEYIQHSEIKKWN